jgi:hypothetical protein
MILNIFHCMKMLKYQFIHISSIYLYCVNKPNLLNVNNNDHEFEDKHENFTTYIVLQNILVPNCIHDYFENIINVTQNKDFKPLGPSQDVHSEKLYFLTLFLVNPKMCNNVSFHTRLSPNVSLYTKKIVLLCIHQFFFQCH